MSIKDTVMKFMRPIIAPYTTPKGAAAGIISLISPAAGALIKATTIPANVRASSGQGPEQSGSRSRFRGMSGMMPLGGGSGRGFGAGGSGDLPLSDLTQYFQREPNLSNRRDAGVAYMNEGGEVMGFFTNMARQSAPGTRLLNPNMPPGPRNPYVPTRVSPPTGGPRLGQIPPSSGPGPFNPGPGNMPTLGSGMGIAGLMEQIQQALARQRARQTIADRRDTQPPPPGMQEGGMVRTGQFIDVNNNGIDDRDEIVDEGGRVPPPIVYAGGTPGFYDGTFDRSQYQDPVGMPIASAPPATQESLFGPNASAVMQEALREYGGMRSPYEGFAEYFSRPVYDRTTPQTEPPYPTGPDTGTPVTDPTPTPVIGADDPRQDLDARIAQLMDPANQGLTREQALYNQLKSIGKGYDINGDGVVTNAEFQMSMNPEFTGVESRIQELMDSGMTRLEALAKQSYGIQQGYDLNNDGMVTNAEYAEFMRNQSAADAAAPEAAAETIADTSPTQAFTNTLGTVQGTTQAADTSTALPDSVQIAIDRLREQGIPGIFGGNFDLAALQKQIAEYLESIGYQPPGATDQQQTATPVPGRAVVDRVRIPMIMR